ncbi:hypothetical protein K443DRAFT_361129 [Laccaria amethystina LaAM-08-1]|uniref:Uncharacterized protein n=1 Tax=Laccaria amethystina LaAM-08-1 TaxID=1095629 RepID=A0A0C9Y5B7_9AGAR|nr:hypothetical protein K443DRAFT_361129 [Laccaria amethystina LaAM-08-1]
MKESQQSQTSEVKATFSASPVWIFNSWRMASGNVLSVSLIRFGCVAVSGGVIPRVPGISSCCAERASLVAVNNWPTYHLSPLFVQWNAPPYQSECISRQR